MELVAYQSFITLVVSSQEASGEWIYSFCPNYSSDLQLHILVVCNIITIWYRYDSYNYMPIWYDIDDFDKY